MPIMYNETAMHIAVENTEIVMLLLSCKNIDVNIYMESQSFEPSNLKEQMSALYMAVKKGNLEIANILCSHRSTNINLPLILSVDSGKEVVPPKRIILEKKTPLYITKDRINQEIYRILLKK